MTRECLSLTVRLQTIYHPVFSATRNATHLNFSVEIGVTLPQGCHLRDVMV